jgi:hypothetical protein
VASPWKIGGRVLAGGRNRLSLDINPAAALIEHHLAIHEGEESPIAAGSDVLAGDKFGTALADKNASGGDRLAAVPFYTQAFADAIATVADAALTFLMCHNALIVDY